MPSWACLHSLSAGGPAGGRRGGQEIVVVDTLGLICSAAMEIKKCTSNLYTGVRVLQNTTMKGSFEFTFKCVLTIFGYMF